MSPSSTDPREARFFSYDEANRTLPLVRRIVADLVAAHQEMRPLMARLDTFTSHELQHAPGVELQEELSKRAEEVERLAEELHDLGCLFKGFGEGLVDWYSYYAGRPVFLCWKVGEPTIEWWHQIDAGFMGRQPIAPEQRAAFRSTPD